MKVALPTIREGETKQEIVDSFRAHLEQNGFTIAEVDSKRPWGAFLRVVNSQADNFIETYFDDITVPDNARRGERSPKFLLVAPHQRLSWQYHDRRAEFWRAIVGTAGVYVSKTNMQPHEMVTLQTGETIELAQGTRHRLVGLRDWGAVAEIWIHTDPNRPSNEEDIYRLQDDYTRTL